MKVIFTNRRGRSSDIKSVDCDLDTLRRAPELITSDNIQSESADRNENLDRRKY